MNIIKYIACAILSLVIVFIFSSEADAYVYKYHIESASLSVKQDKINTRSYVIRKKAMQIVLQRYNSPLVGSVDSFIEASDTYDLDPYMLVSISGLESTFGKHMIDSTYNAWGWGGGRIYFDNWHDAIMTISERLRTRYVDRGADDLYKIGPIYSESPTWAPRVAYFIRQFEQEETRLDMLYPAY